MIPQPTPIPALTPTSWPVQPYEPLTWMTERLKARQPLCYLRFNDGEFYSMFGLKQAPEHNGEHTYTAAVRRSLWEAFVPALCRSAALDNLSPVLVGSWWYEDPAHPAAAAAIQFLESAGLKYAPRWGRGHIWHREELERAGTCLKKPLLDFIEAVRCHGGPRTLVGPEWLSPVAKALKATLWPVPERDAATMKVPPFPNSILQIWCGGFPAKLWAWEHVSPYRYVIDAGSLFDGLCGRESRSWLKRGNGAHAEFYYGEFAKALGVNV